MKGSLIIPLIIFMEITQPTLLVLSSQYAFGNCCCYECIYIPNSLLVILIIIKNTTAVLNELTYFNLLFGINKNV